MKDTFNDRDKTLRLLAAVVKATVYEQCNEDSEMDKALASVMEVVMQSIGERNIETVFAHSESPIETIFLNSVIFGFLRNDPLRLLVYPPVGDFDRHTEVVRESCNGFVGWIAGYIERTGDTSLVSLEEYMEGMVQSGSMPETAYADGIEMLGGTLLDFFNAFHLVLQPSMSIGNKKIRPDMVIWIPSDPKIKIVIECDGFKYHSNQGTFTTDRSRDRALITKGYKVFRFSGKEICDDPLKSGKELVEYLDEISFEKKPTIQDSALHRFEQMSTEIPN